VIKPVANKRKKKRKLNQLKERKTNGTNDIVTHRSQYYHHTV